jgi:hypothetical protein
MIFSKSSRAAIVSFSETAGRSFSDEKAPLSSVLRLVFVPDFLVVREEDLQLLSLKDSEPMHAGQ